MNKEITVITMEAEMNQAKIRVLDQIKSMKNTLENLEAAIQNGETLSESQGLQGNGDFLDVYLTKLVTYQKVIQQVKSIK